MGDQDFDAEMDAIINGGQDTSAAPAEGQGTPDSVQANPQNAQSLKAGGREWGNPSDLAKAYDALYRDYGRKSNELKGLEEWGRFAKYLSQHPELQKELNERVSEYQKRRASGQTSATAQRDSQIPPELAHKIERLEASYATMELDREMQALRGRYKVDQNTMRDVLALAKDYGERKGVDLSLEDAYKLLSFSKQKEAGASEARASLQAKRDGSVGPSSAANLQAAPKGGSWKSDAEWQTSLTSQLKQFGI
jgi:hypothetical protein